MERIWILISLKLSKEATDTELNELQLLLFQNSNTAYKLEIMEEIWNLQPNENKLYKEHQYKMLLHKMEGKGIDVSNFNVEDDSSISIEDNNILRKDRGRFSFRTRKMLFAALAVIVVFLFVGSFFFFTSNERLLLEVKSPNIITMIWYKQNLPSLGTRIG